MGVSQTHRPVLHVLAAFSRNAEAFAWARAQAEEAWGPVALESNMFSFDFTTYYEREMGTDLKKTFWAFERLIDPAVLPDIKHQTNSLEIDFATNNSFPEERPLNLDPGYLTEAKFVLATTKDRDHRLYLRDGMFAEVTLHFQSGSWQKRPWTYPDYQREDYHAFFNECREYLKQRYRDS